MVHTVSLWLLVAAFLGAGLFNAVGTPATRRGFVRWGYPAWWCRVTGGSEMAVAILIGFPLARAVGLIVGTVIVAAAILAVVRHRDLSHLAPLSIFAVLLLVAWLTP